MAVKCLTPVGGYIDNTDGVGNPSCYIHRGRSFADPGSRGHRLPRPWVCKRPPEMDIACEDFPTSLYCFYFTSWNRMVPFTSVLCVFCACIVRFHVVYVSPVSTLATSMCFLRVGRRISAVQPVWSPTTQHTQNTRTKHANKVRLLVLLRIWR